MAVYNHYKRVNMEMRESSRIGKERMHGHDDSFEGVQVAKSNILLLGPTGVGKTYLAQTLAHVMNVPFVIADATTLTEAGYVGDDVETVLQRLIQAADGDVARAQQGIVYIDEIDKIARKSGENTSITRDVSGEGVQQALLKILEGTVASVPVEGTRKHREMETVQIDTRDILFICGGAFVGLADIVAQRLGARESGFGAAWHDHEVPKRELLAQVSADDLADFGLLPEFIGRLPVVSVLEELTEDDLARILVEPENALVKQYQKLFAVDGVTLTFTEGAIRQIAATSIRRVRAHVDCVRLLRRRWRTPCSVFPAWKASKRWSSTKPPSPDRAFRNYSRCRRRKFLVYVRRKAENSCDTPRFCLEFIWVYLIRVAENKTTLRE